MTTEPLNTEAIPFESNPSREDLLLTELENSRITTSEDSKYIKRIEAENATLRAQLADMTRAFNDAVNVANAEKMRRTAIESSRTQEPPTGSDTP